MPRSEPAAVPSAADLFLAVACTESCTGGDLIRSLWLRDESGLANLEAAVEEGLLLLRAGRLRRSTSARAQSLFLTLNAALSYGVDYNPYLGPDFGRLLAEAYAWPLLTADALSAAGVSREMEARLREDGFLVVYREEPLTARIIRNPFLEGLCEHFRLRLEPPGVPDREELARLRRERLELRARLLVEGGVSPKGLSVYQRMIRQELLRQQGGPLDGTGRMRRMECMNRMRANVSEGRRLSRRVVEEYHRILMGATPTAGRFRTGHVAVARNPYFRPADPGELNDRFDGLLRKYRKEEGADLEGSLRLAGWLYNELMEIHPFEDGNSRTARVMLAHVFRERRIPLEEIPPEFEMLFLQASKGARARDDAALAGLFWDMLLLSLDRRDRTELARGRCVEEPGRGRMSRVAGARTS